MPTLRARRHAACLTAVLAGLAAGCSTSVNDPNIVSPSALTSASGLTTVLNGAVGDFSYAFAGNNGTEGVVLLGGLRADEYRNSDYFDTRIQVDRGRILTTNGSVDSLFANLNIARRSAELASSTYATSAPTDYRRARALNVGAYAYLLLAETFCSGIPFTGLQTNGAGFDYGVPRTTQEVFAIARARFDTAASIAKAASGVEAQQELYLAQVGRARALLGMGQWAAAGASVAGVPADFSYELQYSENTNRENNGVFQFNAQDQRWSVADVEGGNGLPFISAKDPRVPVTDTKAPGVDATTDLVVLDKYTSLASPIVLASGVEAQLVRAEAALNGAGGASGALAILNGLRATLGTGADTLALQPDTPSQARQLMAERAFWLFATGHRLGDMRRMVRPAPAGYGFAITSVFPTGPYPKGGASYGTEVNLPIPVDELNNPNFKQCIDRTT